MKTLLRNGLLVSTALVALATPAHAGDKVLYAPAPEWVREADLDALLERPAVPATILRDWQHRLEGGVVTSYADAAMRLENPEALRQMGTISLAWLPDKGDIIVHRLEIHRDGAVIDLLAQGETFDVIRRERGLELRLLDGALTATLAVPGLRVGDVMRLAYSVSAGDQALGREMQEAQFLPGGEWPVGLARAIVSWPTGEGVYWRAEERAGVQPPVERDGYQWLEVSLPLAQRPPMPEDAPSRYHRPEVLRVGTFASWEELSQVMAPHFEAAMGLAEDSPVAAQAQAIMQRTADPRDRAAQAVRLVQDEISYLLNGLDGGNYLPQTADETWAARYGDCKAKSVLLAALLREMDIQAEVVLVATEGGDAVPELLPLPLTFNHMIVHAVIDGQDYWLDGTSSATRLANLADVPPFSWALPLRAGGTGLMAMEQRDPAEPQLAAVLDFDQTAGADFPLLFNIDMRITGPAGATLRPLADAATPDQLRQFATGLGQTGGLQNARITSAQVTYDADAAVARVHVAGVASSLFSWGQGRMAMDVIDQAGSATFNPDRARAAWRDIPVAIRGPFRQRYETRVQLPDEGRGFQLAGETRITGGYGTRRVDRSAELSGGMMRAVSEGTVRAGEIAPADLAAARREARRLAGATVQLVADGDVTWRWELSAGERRRRAQPLLEAYEQAIAFAAADDFGPLQSRAWFYESSYMFAEALEDYSTLVERSPSPWAHHRRAAVLDALGRPQDAIADLRAAYEMDPDNNTAFALARMLAYAGETQAADEVLGALSFGEEDELSMTDISATVLGLSGDADAGQAIVGSLAQARPTSGEALNADCWYRGLFNVALDDALELCTRAVERSEMSAPSLDSRALVHFRQGRLRDAIADLDAALQLVPGLAPSMYLRGVVRLAAGDSGGRDDIRTALGMAPQLARFYARHGISAPQ